MKLYQPTATTSIWNNLLLRLMELVRRFHTACRAFWHLGQIGHRSEYSVERLLAFRDYYERTSVTRVLAVCFLTPLPAILASVLIDCIPLRNPSEGWKANYAFWIRDVFDAFLISFGGISQTQSMIVAGALTNTGVVLASLATTVVYVSLTLGVAAMWRFPVPFGLILLVGPFVLIVTTFAVLNIGPRTIANSPVISCQLKAFAWVIVTQGAVAMVYPIYTAAFYRLSGIEQTAFVLVLPLIKLTAKAIIAKAAIGMHEYVAMIVVFSVDVFNVYYVGICMQISKSIMTTVVMVSLDCFHVILGVRAIFHQVNVARKKRVSRKSLHTPTVDCFEDLPTTTSKLLQEFRASKTLSSRIRVFAPFPLQLSDSRAAMLSDIADINRPTNEEPAKPELSSSPAELSSWTSDPGKKCRTTQVKLLSSDLKSTKRSQVAPASFSLPSQTKVPPRKGSGPRRLLTLMDPNIAISAGKLRAALSHKSTETAVWEMLQALFHAEYLLLAEYVECALPLLYALYLLVLSQLPAANYYAQTAVPFTALVGALTNILLFTLVELVGFVGLLTVLRKKFRVSPLFLLAFVLETHVRTVQGHLLVWTVFILRMALKHQGVASDIHLG